MNEHGVAVPPLWHPLSKHGLRGKPALWTKEDCVRGGDMPRPPPGIAEFCYLRPQASHAPPSADLVAIFHYAIKSEQDFAIKQARGGGMHGRQKTDDYALVINECAPFRLLLYMWLTRSRDSGRPSRRARACSVPVR